MGNGLYLPLVQLEGSLKQGFTVSCGAAVGDAGIFRKEIPYLFHGFYRCCDRRSVVVSVKSVKKFTLLGYKGKLCGCGARIYTEINITMVL